MTSESPRKKLRLEILPEQWAQFKSLMKVLNHDEPEETFEKLLELGVKAIALTSKENFTVCLYTRQGEFKSRQSEICPVCQHEFVPRARLIDDGYRETSVRLVQNDL